jgi:hypothetical protein
LAGGQAGRCQGIELIIVGVNLTKGVTSLRAGISSLGKVA